MRILLTLLLVVITAAPVAAQFESGDYVLGLSLGRHRAGLLVQYFVSDDVALEAYGYSLGFLGLGAVAYPFGEDDASVVFSVTRIAGPRLPFAPASRNVGPSARFAVNAGLGLDFGHVSRRNNDLRGNVGDSFFLALGPTWLSGPRPLNRQRGFLQPASPLTYFWQLGLKSFYR